MLFANFRKLFLNEFYPVKTEILLFFVTRQKFENTVRLTEGVRQIDRQ